MVFSLPNLDYLQFFLILYRIRTLNMEKSKFKDTLLNGGVGEEEYSNAKHLIAEANFRVWKMSAIFFEILFLVLFLISLVFSLASGVEPSLQEMFRSYVIPLGFLSFYMVVISLLFFALDPKSNVLVPLIYISMTAIVLAVGSISIIMNNNLSGTPFFVALVLMPIFIIDRPIRNMFFSVLAGLIYIVLVLTVKDDTVNNHIRDVILASSFTVVSIFISGVINISRIKRCVVLYQVEVQRDTDSLTLVKNVNAYDRKIDELKKKIASKADFKFAIVVCDINNLKYINDTYGHTHGDKLIIRTSKIICDAFKHSPVYRIGGDEFVAILENTDYSNRESLIRHLHEYLDELHSSSNRQEDVSIAMGVGVYNPNKDYDYVSVFSRADAEMYDNKRVLKNKKNA